MSNVKPAKNQAKNQTVNRTEKPVHQKERVNLGCGPLIIGTCLLALLAFLLPHGEKKTVKADKHPLEVHTSKADSEFSVSKNIAPQIPKKTTSQKSAASGKNQETIAPLHKSTGSRLKSENNTNAKLSPTSGQTSRKWLDRIKALLPWENSAKSPSDEAESYPAINKNRQTPRKSGSENITEPYDAEKNPVNPRELDKDHKPVQKPNNTKIPLKIPSSDKSAFKKSEKQADEKSGTEQITDNKPETPSQPGKNLTSDTESKLGTKDLTKIQAKQPFINPVKAKANREEASKPPNLEAHKKASSNDSNEVNPSGTSGSETLNLIRDLMALNLKDKTPPNQKSTVAPKPSWIDNRPKTESSSEKHEDQPAPPPNRPDSTTGKSLEQSREHPKVMNGPWNNSVIQVEQYLKRNLYDADSFEALKWGVVTENTKGYQVNCTYRSKNLFGTLITQTRTFYLNRKGDVYQVKETDKPK